MANECRYEPQRSDRRCRCALLRTGSGREKYLRTLILAACAGLLVLACSGKPKAASTPQTSPTATLEPASSAQVPGQYRSLYDTLHGYIDSYSAQIAPVWDGSKYPVSYTAELLAADSNGGFGILQQAVREAMTQELDAIHSLGATAVTVQIGFPLLDENFYLSLGQSSDQAGQSVQSWIDYYASVVQAAHDRGVKVIVEANPLLTFFTGSATSLDASAYYKSLDVATYKQRRSDHNILVARQLKPDYLVLQSEPQTDAVNSQNRSLAAIMDDPKADTDMVRYFVAQLEAAQVPGLHSSIQLGSGVGTWQGNWQAYVSDLVTIPGLDKIDCHVYNLQPGLDEIGVAMRVADMAHAAGKGVSMAEFWLHKSTSLAGFTTAGDPLLDVRARDAFSFWAPLDQRFLQLVMKVANYKHFDYISAFGFFYWFTLVDYGSLPSPPCPPVYPATSSSDNSACDSRVQNIQNQAARKALADHGISPTGTAYKSLIGSLSVR